MSKPKRPTVDEIVSLKLELETFYRVWHEQQRIDDTYFNGNYFVVSEDGTPPAAFEQVRPPSAKQVIEMAADHSTGNSPRIHVPRRKEAASAQEQSTKMEKAGGGFWYRSIASAPTNILRDWALSGALRGAICASLLYDPDAMPDKPVPSELGGMDSQEYKDAYDEYEAQARSAWPFKLDSRDPMYVFPDPATDGQDYIIEAFKDKAFNVKRRWPNWDYMIPGRTEALRATDEVEFISYWDKEFYVYLVSEIGGKNAATLNPGGVKKHGYGFLPYFFSNAGYGSPFGKPEDRFAGLITHARDLFSQEARLATALDAIAAQSAFPWSFLNENVKEDFRLGGITRVPRDIKPADAAFILRPQLPINEYVMLLQNNRASIQRATLPDSLASETPKSGESGYLRSLGIATGRSRIRSLTAALEKTCEWGTRGFFKLVENKVKGPVSIWGRGLGSESEFITIKPSDINGHGEVYIDLAPSMPQDESTDIANGLKLYQSGGISMRFMLEQYGHIENPDEVMTERLAEDVLRSQPIFGQLVMDAAKVTQVTPGPLGVPGFTAGLLSPAGAVANPASNAGVAGNIPTPPPSPGSLAESNNVIGRTSGGGVPTPGPSYQR